MVDSGPARANEYKTNNAEHETGVGTLHYVNDYIPHSNGDNNHNSEFYICCQPRPITNNSLPRILYDPTGRLLTAQYIMQTLYTEHARTPA